MRRIERLVEKIPGARRTANWLGLVASDPDPRRFLLDMLPRKSIGAEIGTHMGDFSHQILRTVAPAELHLIDPWKHETSETYKDAWYGGQAGGGQGEMDARYSSVCARFHSQIRSGQVKIHRGYSGDVLPEFPNAYFDWIYIDGNHLYEFVKRDLNLSFMKTRTGGYIAGDDYTPGGWWQGAVKKALDEFVEERLVRNLRIQNRQFVFRK
jgi:Methyltransferase domain